jgi:hypothetical protein
MIKTDKHDAIILASPDEKTVLREFIEHMKSSPIPDDEVLANIGLFVTSKNLSRLLFFAEIYKKILHLHGIISEFGVRWGQTLSLFSALRGIFEPFNRHRKIVGFDTFAGFKGISSKDGELCQCQDGSFSVAEGYEQYLDRILTFQEQLNPMSHLKRYELVTGDASQSIPAYFKNHPETIVALAVLDFDIYEPTKVALQAMLPHLMKGSILVFDELCDPYFPGETLALMETFGLRNLTVQRYPMTARVSYVEIG